MVKKRKGYLRRQLAEGLKKQRGGVSQNQFAKKLSIDGSTLNRLENCGQNVTIDTLENLCRDLKCDLVELLNLRFSLEVMIKQELGKDVDLPIELVAQVKNEANQLAEMIQQVAAHRRKTKKA